MAIMGFDDNMRSAKYAHYSELVQMAAASYEGNPRPMDEIPLTAYNGLYSLDPAEFGPDGVWSANGRAQALTTLDSSDGQNVLTISFRGTDQAVDINGKYDTDFQDYPGLMNHPSLGGPWSDYYIWHFKPLLDAVESYVQYNDVDKINVTGHSLGGGAVNQMRAMTHETQYFNDTFDNANYFAVASPNMYEDYGTMINFGHDNDPVYGLIDEQSVDNGPDNIVMWTEGGGGYTLEAHTPVTNYESTLERLYKYSYIPSVEDLDQDAEVIMDFSDHKIDISNMDDGWQPKRVFGEIGKADHIVGGGGDDLIVGGGGHDTLTGGGGYDTFGFVKPSKIYPYAVHEPTITDIHDGDILEFASADLLNVVNGDGTNVHKHEAQIDEGFNESTLYVNYGGDETREVILEGSHDASEFHIAGPDTLVFTGDLTSW